MTQDRPARRGRMKKAASEADGPLPSSGRPARAALQKEATDAQARGDYGAAIAHWAEFRRHYPGTKIGFVGGMRAAKSASQTDLLASLLQESLAKFPNHAGRLAKMAKPGKAVSRGLPKSDRVDTDDDQWQTMMRMPPTNATAELDAAMAPFKVKQRRGRELRFKVSLARVETVAARFPRDVASRHAHISVLRRMKRGAKAVGIAAKYAADFPRNEKLALAYLGTLDDAREFDLALEHATALKRDFPASVKIEVAYIQALSRLSRLDAADAACKQALALFPDTIDLICEHASLATRRGDWTEAFARWMAAEAIQPESTRIKAALEAVRNQLAELQLPGTEFQQGETGRFFAQFESMGGTDYGCEFGIVQRKYGSASLGLLRWSAISIDKLTEALNRDFEGLGLLENTALGTLRVNATREEWLIQDNAYGLGSHTFIEVKDVPEDKMLVQTARRLKFLGGKLLEDIRSGLKILVYKIMHPVDEGQMRALYQAVRRQGPAQLICILKADDKNPRGSIRKLEDGLLVGYVGHYMAEAEIAGDDKGIDFALWKDIATRAAAEFAPLRTHISIEE